MPEVDPHSGLRWTAWDIHSRGARAPAYEERVDLGAWRRAEAEAWEKVEDGRWWSFRQLDTRARKEWAELHKRQEEMRRSLDRESRTVLGRLRIWRIERSLRELVGAVRGREDLVEGWREDLARDHRDERTALGKARSERAREIERGVRESYRRGLADAERRAWAVRERVRERQETWGAGERPEHPHPHSPAPRSRAWRGRVRAMNLAFPAIAARIVQKRLIREWFRDIYGLWDRLLSAFAAFPSRGVGRRDYQGTKLFEHVWESATRRQYALPSEFSGQVAFIVARRTRSLEQIW